MQRPFQDGEKRLIVGSTRDVNIHGGAARGKRCLLLLVGKVPLPTGPQARDGSATDIGYAGDQGGIEIERGAIGDGRARAVEGAQRVQMRHDKRINATSHLKCVAGRD